MLKLEIFRKQNKDPNAKVFTHYGTNEGQNFWDTVKQNEDGSEEDMIGYDDGKGNTGPTEGYLSRFTDYKGEEIDRTRFQRAVIGAIVVDVTAEDLKESPVLFFRMTEWDEKDHLIDVPIYYYSAGLTDASDQNQYRTSYRVECPIDSGASYWCYFHSYMKDIDETIMFMHKMCDHFIYLSGSKDEEGNVNLDYEHLLKLDKHARPIGTGFTGTGTLDYLGQPYLSRISNDAVSALYMNDPGAGLSLDDGLDMNGCDHTLYNMWEQTTAPISVIDCSKSISPEDSAGEKLNSMVTDKGFNPKIVTLTEDKSNYVIEDKQFNSKGKYRYLVTKFGNNFCGASEGLNTTNDQYNYLITNAKEYKVGDVKIFDNEKGKKILYEIENLITNTNVSKQCINTKKVGTQKGSGESAEQQVVHLNGELLCIIPFPKGKGEELYLFYLNSHDKGIVLGNGSVLGMLINDIPPAILGAALRNYNDKNVANNLEQTIGDKLSFRNANGTEFPEGHYCPIDLVALQLNGIGDGGSVKHTFEYIYDYIDHITQEFNITGHRLQVPENLTEGYYCVELGHGFNAYDYFVGDYELTNKDGSKGKFADLGTDKYQSSFTGTGGYVYLKYNGKGTTERSSGTPCYIDEEMYISTMAEKMSVPVETAVIPPIPEKSEESIKTKTGYHLSTKDPINTCYYNEDSHHYFPSIFHDFSNIPVTICNGNPETITGDNPKCGSDFGTPFYNMMNSKYTKNIKENDPLFYNPNLGVGTYYIDGQNKIQLTSDLIDGNKFIKPDGNVYLNVSFNTNTNYMLDISEIKNMKYPHTKTSMEFITQDRTTYPFTCEAFNRGYEENLTTIETAKGSKDITNKYAMKNATLGGVGSALSGPISGAVSGATMGTKIAPGYGTAIGGVIGGITGFATGMLKGGLTYYGAKLACDEANDQFNNKGSKELAGIAGQPTIMPNNGGFTSGSLVYSPNKEESKSYELFRRYSAPELDLDKLGYEVAMDGKLFMSQCRYLDYNTKRNFNIIQCNLISKQFVFKNYLKEKMFGKSPMFSQDTFIESFMSKLADANNPMRLFKCEYDPYNLKNIIEGNIDIKMQFVKPQKDL